MLDALTRDADNPASVVACVARAREGAAAVRDVISAEMWEAINTTHLRLRDGDFADALAVGPVRRSTSTSRSARRCSGA